MNKMDTLPIDHSQKSMPDSGSVTSQFDDITVDVWPSTSTPAKQETYKNDWRHHTKFPSLKEIADRGNIYIKNEFVNVHCQKSSPPITWKYNFNNSDCNRNADREMKLKTKNTILSKQF